MIMFVFIFITNISLAIDDPPSYNDYINNGVPVPMFYIRNGNSDVVYPIAVKILYTNPNCDANHC